jgi:hypothetical protein
VVGFHERGGTGDIADNLLKATFEWLLSNYVFYLSAIDADQVVVVSRQPLRKLIAGKTGQGEMGRKDPCRL